ncbi:glycoside hydrolase family 35 protein [Actinoplanes utahensis]|uniref:Beta-galactosidase n=1 Tax=Actinoplanes utahensis TaxID=1869 RepID=A0A0A6UN67_ACTUT|nr:beta-galactosidase family protein [Actinoplanes utahensis]KHD76841.1 beta-galactosidase [Actinoplanes utahensis]GIF33434.1 beta-galactosidase [Actinoplanes utahensis]
MGSFAIGEREFLLDGEPFRIISGALHYFRVHPDQWADRIRKARQMGLNTIETYVAWNAHAPADGDFDLTGGLDLGRFLDLVAAEGLYAIVRPGPYICAEWANGGLPAWLFRDGAVGIRRDEPRFMAAVTRYYEQLAPVVVARQVDRGGPIILVQVENEYGAYGADKSYLRKLTELTRRIGVTVPLTTVDQPLDDMLDRGSLPGLHKTASFGSRAAERLAALRRHQPTGPLMCSEFWNGWFDSWGGVHHVTPADQCARELGELLECGASVNIYMFHGGTNFGFTNGANDKGTYRPIATSYDYDAPLDEAGDPTAKYWAYREVIGRYAPLSDDVPAAAAPAPAFGVRLGKVLPLWDVLDRLGKGSEHDEPPTMDAAGQSAGLALYRTEIDLAGPGVLHIAEVRDRAQVFLDRQALGTLEREHKDRSLALPAGARGVLELLVEDQGRVDYGPRLGEPKGLIGPVTVNGEPLRRWEIRPLDLVTIPGITEAFAARPPEEVTVLAGPAFAEAEFDLPAPGDLFLDTSAWGKGVVWINGFCLGRYWSRGPQQTLHVPGPVLRPSGNRLVVLELQASGTTQVDFVPAPRLGPLEE